ncbi:MAG: DUF5916 domain-containing protein [Myxococcota bacterium]
MRAQAALLGLVLMVSTAEAAPPSLVAAPRMGPIVVDGRLDEPDWARAQPGLRFIERVPTPGAPAPDGHELRVLVDDEALYVGVRLPLPEGRPPRALELTRDSFDVFDDDAISLKLDVRADQRTTVGFVINAAGTQLDYLALESGKQFRREYDAVWTAKTTVEADAWVAEFRLPVAALGIPNARSDVIGINVTRDHSARAATYDWAPMPPELGAFNALYYGQLQGVDTLGGGRPLVLIPYLLGSLASNERLGDMGIEGSLGGDIQLRLLDDLWSELTINPDFAQVDLDDPVVNFDRFPLFFPERRPFFLTGLQVFDFGVPQVNQLFFSRRIGLDATGGEVPVWGGFKLYGTIGDYQVGLFQVLTGAQDEGPGQSFTIARFRRNFGRIAHVGILGTLRGDTSLFEEESVDFEPDWALGIDGSLRLIDGRLQFEGFGALSDNSGAPQAATARASMSYRGRIAQPSLSVLFVDEDFDPAIGFVRRQDIVLTRADLNFVRRPRSNQTLQVDIGLNTERIQAASAARNVGQSTGASFDLRWRTGWSTGASARFVEDVVDEPFDLFAVREVTPDRYRGFSGNLSVSSPSVRNPTFNAEYIVDSAFFGGVRHGPSIGGTASFGAHWATSTTAGLSFAEFPDGFQARVLTGIARLRYAPNTLVVTNLILQHRSVGSPSVETPGPFALTSIQTGLLRVRWRYLPGSDIFWVTRFERNAVRGEPEALRFDTTLKLQFRYDLLL